MKLFICEKPSQAADVAKAMGQARKTATHWESAGGRVTWAFGHLLESASPESYNPVWATWSFSELPMIPERFSYLPRRGVGERIRDIGRLLKEASGVVIATDAGREGEVIARELLDHLRWKGPVDRLWMSATDPESVRKALANLRPGSSTEPLYAAGKARSEADWLVGLNMTRAMTLLSGKRGSVTSVGRVQTPTLALVVRRDRERTAFKSVKYFDVAARDARGLTLVHAPDEAKRIMDRGMANGIADALPGLEAVLSVKTEPKSKAPPLPFDLSSLQAECNRRFAWTAKHALTVAQSLYEEHKATTYPRTECRYLPEEQLGDVPVLFAHAVALPPFAHLAKCAPVPRKTIYNTAKVEEHHAIIPTKTTVKWAALSADAQRCYALIVGQFLAGLLPDYEYLATEVSAVIDGRRFAARGVQATALGWKQVFASQTAESGADETDESEEKSLPAVSSGEAFRVESASAIERTTKAPPAYTEARLIEDMKAVAKFVTDPRQKARLKETSGIGTAATRHEILETLKHHEYLAVKGRNLSATPKAHSLIERLERDMPALADVGESAEWEDALAEVAKGRKPASDFLTGIKTRVNGYVDGLRSEAPPAAPAGESVSVGGIQLADHGDYFTAPGVKGRIYKGFFGHVFTAEEVANLLGGEQLQLADCKAKSGAPLGPKKVRFNRKRSPFPGVEFCDEASAAGSAPRRRRLLGFTVVELIVVLTVIGVLAAILVPVGRGLYLDAQARAVFVELKNIETYTREYINKFGALPKTPPDSSLVSQGNYFFEGTDLSQPVAPNFGQASRVSRALSSMDWRHVLLAGGIATSSDLRWSAPQKLVLPATLAGTVDSLLYPRDFAWEPGQTPESAAFVPMFADNAALFGVNPASIATRTQGSTWFFRLNHVNLASTNQARNSGYLMNQSDDAPFRATTVVAQGSGYPPHWAGQIILRQDLAFHPSQLLTNILRRAREDGWALVLDDALDATGILDDEIRADADNLLLPTATRYAEPAARELNSYIARQSRILEVAPNLGSGSGEPFVRLIFYTRF